MISNPLKLLENPVQNSAQEGTLPLTITYGIDSETITAHFSFEQKLSLLLLALFRNQIKLTRERLLPEVKCTTSIL
jgi:5-enolpyruvylshikimate-3-phosphate synthase